MTVKTEGRHATEGVLSEANGYRSRANLTIAASSIVLAAMILGMIATGDEGGGAQTVAAAVALPTNTVGTGAVGSLTADAHAMKGRWYLVCTEPAANAGTFEVRRPDGTVEGKATVAAAYNGALNFTISDATDFAAGDGFYIDVSYADGATAGQYKPWDPDGVDGSEDPAAIALYPATTGAGETVQIAALVRDCEFNINMISWPDGFDAAGADAATAVAAIAALATKGIIVR